MAESKVPAVGQTGRRLFATNQRIKAPEKMRTKVKVAASMLVCLRAARHKRELLAKAIIARRVRAKTLVDFTTEAEHENVRLFRKVLSCAGCELRNTPAF